MKTTKTYFSLNYSSLWTLKFEIWSDILDRVIPNHHIHIRGAVIDCIKDLDSYDT